MTQPFRIENDSLLSQIAAQRAVPAVVLEDLLASSDPYARFTAAANPRLSGDTMRRAARSGDRWTLLGLASNPSTSKDLLLELSEDTTPGIGEAAQEALRRRTTER